MAKKHKVKSIDQGFQVQRKRWQSDKLFPYLFISPFILSYLVLFLGPALYSLVLSFFRFKGYGDATFIGISNYTTILDYHVFWTELGNTIFYWLAHVFPMMIIAFLLAVLVRSKLVKHKRLVKPLIFLPNIVATVAAALVFQSLFSTQYGLINNLLGIKLNWLEDSNLTKIVVVLLIVWRGMGFWFVVFLAGLTSVNPELEEAAEMDGAVGWQRLLHIILPLMRGTFLFAFVIDAANSFRLFTEPNVLVNRGGSLVSPDVAPLLNLLVGNLQSANFGQASAVGWILFVLVVIVSVAQIRILRNNSEESE